MAVSDKLPQSFFENMKAVLAEDYDEYIKNLDKTPYRGLRINTLKTDKDTVQSTLGINMSKTPFCADGYYIDNNIKGLGNEPLHHAGAFYLQEPSAMSAVEALNVNKGDIVLDLCSAPGGKSTQIAAKLGGTGLLVSNEITPSRARALCSNIERMGIKNAVVTNAHPQVICGELEGFFDKVLVDAPCSGEGMLRREPAAVSEWRLENHKLCALRSAKILDSAAVALKPGGTLVYSTCTLSAEENEQTIDAFLDRHPDFKMCEIPQKFGRAAYSKLCGREEIAKARRILYQDGGEGHFVAKIKKLQSEYIAADVEYFEKFDKIPLFDAFISKHFAVAPDCVKLVGESVFILPEGMPVLRKTRVIRCGVFAGNIMKNRFEPSHQLYVSTPFAEHKNILDLDNGSDDIRRFLHGEVIPCALSGYTAVAVNGNVTGFGKGVSGVLKNHYPKGLRTFNIH